MSTKQYEYSLEAGKYHRRFKGSFTPNGAAVSSASGANRGTDFTPSHVSTGVYRVTLLDDTGAALKFAKLVSARAGFQAENDYVRPTQVEIGAVDPSAGTIDIKVYDEAAILEGSATYDPPSLPDGDWVVTTVTVTGAAVGDYVEASFSNAFAGVEVFAWVSAADTVSVRFRNALENVLTGSATYDAANLADGAGETTTITVTGAALGDFVDVSHSIALAGITVTAWVSAPDTVSVRVQNESGGAVDLASGTLRARVYEQDSAAINLASGTLRARVRPQSNGAKALRNITASGVLRRINFEAIIAIEDIPGSGAAA